MSGHIEIIKAPSLTFLSLVQEEDIGSINACSPTWRAEIATLIWMSNKSADMDEQQVIGMDTPFISGDN
jgi:hypothetical protein